MMRKLVALVLVATAVVASPPPVPTPPADAAYEWVQSWCRPDVWWYHYPGHYVQYWRDGAGVWPVHENWPRHAFARKHLSVYRDNGYECGRMGVPVSEMVTNGPGWWRQAFERGALWYGELNQEWFWCPWGDSWCYYT